MSEMTDFRKQLMTKLAMRLSSEDVGSSSPEGIVQLTDNNDKNIEQIMTKDPGVTNENANGFSKSGNLVTATASRNLRKQSTKTVMYAEPAATEYNRSPRSITQYDNENTSGYQISRNSPLNNRYLNADTRSLRDNTRLYASNNDIRGANTPRKRSVVTIGDAQSIRSTETHAPPPTTPEENKKLTIESTTKTMSCIYAVFLVTLGLIIYVADCFNSYSIGAIYSIVLIGIGFIYMVYLIIDIQKYKNKVSQNSKIKFEHKQKIIDYFAAQEVVFEDTRYDEFNENLKNSPIFAPPNLIPVEHHYCFNQGRHSGSFYLKLGAAGFAVGLLIHSVLILFIQIMYLLDDNENNSDCVDSIGIAVHFMKPIFAFLELYFIFKYSNVIIIRNQVLARFAFMHYVGTSLCLWLANIVTEIILALTLYAQSVYGNYGSSDNGTSYAEASSKALINIRIFDISSLYREECATGDAVNAIFQRLSPYLYPFSVEFNILIVAVFYIIWANIGECQQNKDFIDDDQSYVSDTQTLCKFPSGSVEDDFTSNLVIYADCHASNRGLFGGILIAVLTIGMLIIGFVFSSVGEGFLEIGYNMNDATKLVLHASMLLASFVALKQIHQLDINEHPISLLDDILLFICLPAFIMEVTLSLVATIYLDNYIKSIDMCIMGIQAAVQTILISDGLRRCSNSRKLRRKKSGREVIMFLLICNVTMWLFYTFSYKSPESLDERYTYYGKILWSILGHISLPLIMFFRFHSSVCFADMWDSAFKPGSEH